MEQKMSVCELTDDEYYSTTEALLVQLAAKECLLVADSSADYDILHKVPYLLYRFFSFSFLFSN